MSVTDPSGEPAPERGGAYTYTGPIAWEYSPELDRDADPGEIVWTWVAFEEDASHFESGYHLTLLYLPPEERLRIW